MTPGMPLQPSGIGDQLAFLEPAAVDHIMILDAGDGDREIVAGMLLDHVPGRAAG